MGLILYAMCGDWKIYKPGSYAGLCGILGGRDPSGQRFYFDDIHDGGAVPAHSGFYYFNFALECVGHQQMKS